MRYTALPRLDETFRSTGNNGEYIFRKVSIPIPGEDLNLNCLFTTPGKRTGFYYNVAHAKHRIVIHYTAGQIRSDMSTLSRQDYHVSVPFVIARDGTIYQLYSSKYWSGHIGKGLGNINTGNAQDKCTIGIELSNYGWLKEKDGNLETCYSRVRDASGKEGPVDVYCALTETEAYQKTEKPYRQQTYFATYTPEQYDSLIILLRYLTKTYNIPRQFLPQAIRYEADAQVLNFKGIVTHVNYRTDGKWDIGPAFDWEKLEAGVKAAQYTPLFTSRSLITERGVEEMIQSEDALEHLLPGAADPSTENESYEDSDEVKNKDAISDTNANRQPNLYALLVAINEYNGTIPLSDGVSFPPLRGCVSDAEKMQAYLEADTSFNKNIKLLVNKDATRPAVVKQFQQHLQRAEKGDTVLFYFSGHGTQEYADSDAWENETDGKLESIACYYEENTKHDFLLADKELRYLLKKVSDSGAHVVTIFDCCHSADNTRNSAYVKANQEAPVEKRIPYVFPRREWKHFLFSEKFSPSELKKKGEAALLPEGMHIQLSACEANESAVEVGGEGVFTKTLLKNLVTAKGLISYYTLRNRVRQYLRTLFEQKPRIYVANGNQDLLFATFLNRANTAADGLYSEAIYNQALGWQMNLGTIHGIGEQTKTITLFDPADESITYQAKPARIGPDYTVLTLEKKADKTRIYRVYTEGLASSSLKIFFDHGDMNAKTAQPVIEALLAERDIRLEDEENEAMYCVRAAGAKLYISNPGDPYRPLVKPVSSNDPSILLSYLRQVSKWEFLRNLRNENAATALAGDVIKTSIVQIDGSLEKNILENDRATINFSKSSAGWGAVVRIHLTNTGNTNVYVSALLLGSQFSSFGGFLNPSVYLLEPGNSVYLSLGDKKDLSSTLEDMAKYYNWPGQTEYLKLIASTEEFDVQSLILDSLPAPVTPEKERGGERGLVKDETLDKRKLTGWTTRTIALHYPNPLYNKLSDEETDGLFHDEETAWFASGLYPEKGKKKNGRADGKKNEVDTEGTHGLKPVKSELRKRSMSMAKSNGYMPSPVSADAPIPYGAVVPPPAAPSAQAPAAPPQSPARDGQLEYEIPGTMEVSKPYTCQVNIAGNEVAAALLRIGEQSVRQEIRITDEMTVQLIDTSGGQYFTIVPMNTDRQGIFPGEKTTWKFKVTPKTAGTHSLSLKVTIHFSGRNKDLDILEKQVLVTSNGEGQPPVGIKKQKRILFLAANPDDTARLRIGAETRQIQEELGLGTHRESILFTIHLAVTARTLTRSILQEDPAIIHFSGHGEEEGICLETENGVRKYISAEALGTLFGALKNKPLCVFLNACYSEIQARAIAHHVPFVIGMKGSVKDRAALAFATGFYQAIADGEMIPAAFKLALAAMQMEAEGQQEVPVILGEIGS